MSSHDAPINLELINVTLRLVRTMVVIGILSAMIGCDRSRQDIVGKWQAGSESSAMVWEFANDGSVQMGSSRGRYSFGDRGRIKIETSAATSVYQIELSGDHMTLKDPSGSKLEFTKLK
jgi:hypothetical protein